MLIRVYVKRLQYINLRRIDGLMVYISSISILGLKIKFIPPKKGVVTVECNASTIIYRHQSSRSCRKRDVRRLRARSAAVRGVTSSAGRGSRISPATGAGASAGSCGSDGAVALQRPAAAEPCTPGHLELKPGAFPFWWRQPYISRLLIYDYSSCVLPIRI